MQKNADGREFRVLTPFQVVKTETVAGRKGATIVDGDGSDTSSGAQGNPRVLRCSGYANWCGENSTYVDLVGDVVVPSGVELSVWQDNPQILWQHDPWLSVGQGTTLERRNNGVYVEFDVHLDTLSAEDAYRVENGLVKFLSIGFRVLDGEFREIGAAMAEGPCGFQEAFFITRSLLLEISLVTIPANSASGFSIVKQIDSETKAFGGSFVRKDSADKSTDPETNETEDNTLSTSLKLKYSDFMDAATLEDLKAKGVDVEQETEVKLVDLIHQVSGEVSAAAVKEVSDSVAELKEQIGELGKSIEALGATAGGEAEGDAGADDDTEDLDGDAGAEGDAGEADGEGADGGAEGEGDDAKDVDVSVEEIEALRNTLRDLSKTLSDL